MSNQTKSKSQQIVELYKAGRTRSEISKELGILYQFVNNVLRNKNLLTQQEDGSWK